MQTTLRKVGGSIMLAVPPALLELLELMGRVQCRHLGERGPLSHRATEKAVHAGRTSCPMLTQMSRSTRRLGNGLTRPLSGVRRFDAAGGHLILFRSIRRKGENSRERGRF